MTKYIVFSLFVFSTLLLPSCEDHIETGIEGSWQMTHITQTDGTEITVDTIFYRFKKGVFQHFDITKGAWFGMYEEKGDSLFLSIKQNAENFKAWDGESTRNFKIEKLKSRNMVLSYNDDMYYFRIF